MSHYTQITLPEPRMTTVDPMRAMKSTIKILQNLIRMIYLTDSTKHFNARPKVCMCTTVGPKYLYCMYVR